jgi:hypothetical protein
MGTKTNSLSDGVQERGEFSARESSNQADEAFLDLVTKDWNPAAGPRPTLEELQSLLDKSLTSGMSTKTLSEIFEESIRITKERQTYRA